MARGPDIGMSEPRRNDMPGPLQISSGLVNPAHVARVAVSALTPEAGTEREVVSGADFEAANRTRLAQAEEQAQQRDYEEGSRRGREAAERELQTRVQQISNLLENLEKQQSNLFSTVEDDIVNLVFESVVRIAGERTASRNAVQEVVKRVMSARDPGVLIVRVSQGDFALLSRELPSLGGENGETRFRVVEDQRVTLGGCILESDRGSLDARLETQLERLRKTLIEARFASAE